MWSEKLKQLGIELPEVVAPLAAYVPATRVGDQVWTSGQLPLVGGQLATHGKVGDDVSEAEAYTLARQAGLNALAAVDALVGLDSIGRVIKLVGFVASAPDFTGQPKVINGASDLIGEIFGDEGVHARSAVGVTVLPLDSPVEVELIVELVGSYSESGQPRARL